MWPQTKSNNQHIHKCENRVDPVNSPRPFFKRAPILKAITPLHENRVWLCACETRTHGEMLFLIIMHVGITNLFYERKITHLQFKSVEKQNFFGEY